MNYISVGQNKQWNLSESTYKTIIHTNMSAWK